MLTNSAAESSEWKVVHTAISEGMNFFNELLVTMQMQNEEVTLGVTDNYY